MPTARELFWHGWDGSIEGEAFVRYSPIALKPFGVPQADCDFLAEVGLPAWAAPHMHFGMPTVDVLRPPEDPYGNPYPLLVSGFGMIGSSEDWPLCFDETRPGVVVWLHPTEAPDGAVVNTSAPQLAACLRAYNAAVREALTYGEQHGATDAWRRGRYPRTIDEQLAVKMRALDPAVGETNSFWARHFDERFGVSGDTNSTAAPDPAGI